MMDKEITRNIYLGLFVSIGFLFLIVSVYYIGSKKNIFSSTFKVYAVFSNINGLQTGNNIRFLGIDVGTVKKITVVSDSEIHIMGTIEKKYQFYLKKNAVAVISSDGLMGNKIIIIRNGGEPSQRIEDFDTVQTISPIESEAILRTLTTGGENIKAITDDLREITQKINKSSSLWKLLSDSVIPENLKEAMVNINVASRNSAMISGDLRTFALEITSGTSSFGAMLKDTTLSGKIKKTIAGIQFISDTLALVTGDLKNITQQLNSGQGAIGTIIMDTAFAKNIRESAVNIREGSENFNENMEALKHNILLRKYFKKKEEGVKQNP